MLMQPATVLIASADPDLVARVKPVFLGSGAAVEVVFSAEAALEAMMEPNSPDLALVDAALPGMPMAQLLEQARANEAGAGMAIVLIADSVAQEWIDRVDEGVLDDVILRDADPTYWQLRTNSVLRTRGLLSELGHMRDNEARNAQLDRLTGAYNREGLLSWLFRETDRVQRLHTPLALVLFDVDDFGHWNARLGVDACDEMLCKVVHRTARLLRTYDLMGRTGKDEFLVALPGCEVSNALMLAERLRLEVFSTPFRVRGESIRLSACFGIAQSQGRSPVIVLREAEQALARARQTGPESIQTFEGPLRSTPAPVTFSLKSGEELLAW